MNPSQKSFFSLPPTHCSRCGKLLTNNTSIQAGIGPVCKGKHSGSSGDSPISTKDFSDFTLFDPIENGIVLKRDERGVWTNVLHTVTHHSPTGFEFGYAGSGPADLALNICEMMLNRLGYTGERTKCFDGDCFSAAYEFHQEFKRDFIANVDHDHGGVIPLEKVERWIKAKIILDHAEVSLQLSEIDSIH